MEIWSEKTQKLTFFGQFDSKFQREGWGIEYDEDSGEIQMEGICREVGTPQENEEFIQAFQAHFPSSFQRYSMLEKERLFLFEPKFIERWLYDNGIPYVEQFDICSRRYSLTLYSGE